MLLVLPGGTGKTHYHHLRRGIDTETTLSTCIGPVLVGYIGYLASTTGNGNYYTKFNAALIRALEKRYPGSLAADGGSEESVDMLVNWWYIPSEIPLSQCHLVAPSESTVLAAYDSRGEKDPEGSLACFHEHIEKAESFATARLDLSREDIETMSLKWRAGPKLKEADVVWLRDRIFEDEELVRVWGGSKLKEMEDFANKGNFHMHYEETVEKS